MNFVIYKGVKKLRILNSIIERIENRMEILYPGDRSKVIKNTQTELCKIIICSIVVFISFVLYGQISAEYIFMAFCVLFVLVRNSIFSKFDKLELKLLKQFEKFIQDVRFQFKYDGMIDEALQDTLINTDNEMMLQGNLIYESLNDSVMGKSSNYKDIAPNHFFLTFYALCESVKLYGDKVVDKRSAFLTNLSYLADDINTEILKREKISSQFMGLIGVTILPLFAIKPICDWGKSSISGLYYYYNGIEGKVTIIIIALVTLLIINIITKLRYPIEYDNQKNKLVVNILKIEWLDKILMRIIGRNYKHYYEMDKFLKSLVYKYNIKEFIVYRILCSVIGFVTALTLLLSVGFYKSGMLGVLLMIVIITFVIVITYYYEFIMLLFRQQLLKIDREEEVVRFQSVIMILMNIDRISIENILEWMEQFASVFKNVIEEISDSLVYKGNEVFRDIKERIHFLPLERIMDCFIACDSIGISKAFSDIESDRKYYIDKHRQDNEIIVNNKALIAKFIAFIPICMVIIMVLVVPFIYEGLQQLSSFDFM